MVYAVHAKPKFSRIWHQPSALRGFTLRSSQEPPAVPPARPVRKTARMIAKTYTVASSKKPSRHVQTTSAPSATAPESAIKKKTNQQNKPKKTTTTTTKTTTTGAAPL